MPPTPFRYLREEEQLALAAQALASAVTPFKSWRATLKTRRLLDGVVPIHARTPLDRDCFLRALERLLGQVIIDELGRPWLLLHIRRDSHNCSAVTLRRLDGEVAREEVA